MGATRGSLLIPLESNPWSDFAVITSAMLLSFICERKRVVNVSTYRREKPVGSRNFIPKRGEKMNPIFFPSKYFDEQKGDYK